MISLIYDGLLFLVGLVALPRLLWLRVRQGKYRQSLSERLGITLPDFEKQGPVIWIHVVSVGESRAVSTLYKTLREHNPDATFVISSITETGLAEAKRSLPGAQSYFFLPLDFSWNMRRLAKRIQPDLLILVEGEYWFNLINFVKKSGAKIALVNGKISERSFSRFQKASFFSRNLFSKIDTFCLQSSRFKARFLQLGVPEEKLIVTGNLKLDVAPLMMSASEKKQWKTELGISDSDRVLVIGSTHDPEEVELLSQLKIVWEKIPALKVIIVPRHPERFSQVAEQIRAQGFSLMSYSKREQKTGDERVILIDAMGLLLKCYQIADLAVVAGSFTDKVGGHNIFEPVQAGVPVLFGPFMRTQLDLVDLVLSSRCGKQVSLDEAPQAIFSLFSDQDRWNELNKNCLKTAQEAQGATERTWNCLALNQRV